MTITEQDLRELLDHDSHDGPHGGVTVADVDRRAGAIRRRRGQVAGSIAAVALAVTFLTGTPAETPEETWRGTLAVPSPTWTEDLNNRFVFLESYREGGKPKTLTFSTGAKEVSVAVSCPVGSYALAWLNGKLVAHGRCDRVHAVVAGSLAALRGENKVVAALIPVASAAGADRTAAQWADEALAFARPYPARWTAVVLKGAVDSLATCQIPQDGGRMPQHAMVNPTTGAIEDCRPGS
ncbi:hypothetical protein ACGFNP_23330 [Nonomuraea sp. NPDC049269]|uniref:hypothetical protein n=1 Tax=Nonomuraea sp. NPDC049269 TaxID=3364349 RepID=UPI00371591AF